MNNNKDDYQSNIVTEERYDLHSYYVSDIIKESFTSETLTLAIEGDKDAFSSLFMNTYRYVYSVARHYLDDDEDIYDAIQETYTKVYTNIKKLKDPGAFLSWLGKIAENTSKDILSAKAKNAPVFNNESNEIIDEEVVDLNKIDVNMDITAIFSQLSAEDAEILTYVYYDGFKVADIARMQCIAKTTIYSRLNAAKRRLKELLKVNGIEKPLYGGDLVTLITTTIRNSIGTNLLSAAVADEILQSVINNNTKAGVVISKIAKKQRNSAVLRVASFIVLIAVLTTCVTIIAYYGVQNFINNKGQSPKGNHSTTILDNLDPTQKNDDEDISYSFSPTSDTISTSQIVTGTPPILPTPSATSINIIGIITDTSMPIDTAMPADTSVPVNTFMPADTFSPVTTVTNTPESTVAPTVTTAHTATSKPTNNYTSTPAATSKPTANYTATPVATAIPTPSTPTPPQLTTIAATLYSRNAIIHNGYIYFKHKTKLSICKAKLDGSGCTEIVSNMEGRINKIIAADDYLFYYLGYQGTNLYKIAGDNSECIATFDAPITNINAVGKTLYVEIEFNSYYKTNIDTINFVETKKDYANWCNSYDGTKTYYRVCKRFAPPLYDLFEYDSITGETRLITESNEGPYDNYDLSTIEPFICDKYMVYTNIDDDCDLDIRLISLDDPSKIIKTFDIQNHVYAFTPYNGGSVVFNKGYYSISKDEFYTTNINVVRNTMTIPNDDYIYIFDDNDKLYKILPDGSGKTYLQ